MLQVGLAPAQILIVLFYNFEVVHFNYGVISLNRAVLAVLWASSSVAALCCIKFNGHISDARYDNLAYLLSSANPGRLTLKSDLTTWNFEI